MLTKRNNSKRFKETKPEEEGTNAEALPKAATKAAAKPKPKAKPKAKKS